MSNSQFEMAQPSVNRLARRKNVVDLLLPPVSTSEYDANALHLLNSNPVTPSTGEYDAVNGNKLSEVVVSPRDPSLKTSILNGNTDLLKSSFQNGSKDRVPQNVQPYGTPSQQVIIGSNCDQPCIQPNLDTSTRKDPLQENNTDTEPVENPIRANTGRWTEAEHKLFLKGLETFPYRAWKKIATLIKTRTVVQIRTHAQKYYQKLEKEEAKLKEREQQLLQQQTFANNDVLTSKTDVFLHGNNHSSKRKTAIRKRKYSDNDINISKKCHKESKILQEHMNTNENLQYTQQSMRINVLEERSNPLILDFNEDKSFNGIEYSLQMVDNMDTGFSGMDNEELLLSDDENLDWFSSTSEKEETIQTTDSNLCSSMVPFTLNQYQFSPLYSESADSSLQESYVNENLNIEDLEVIEDDDFVLDPEKFLSDYFK